MIDTYLHGRYGRSSINIHRYVHTDGEKATTIPADAYRQDCREDGDFLINVPINALLNIAQLD